MRYQLFRLYEVLNRTMCIAPAALQLFKVIGELHVLQSYV